jgi:perosamine synthetase
MIPHNKPSIEKDDIESVIDTLNSKWIAQGEKVKEFECELAKYLSNDGYAVAVDSGTSGLHLALLSLGIRKGDEVILPTYVCTAVLNAVNYTGAIPVFTDITSYDFNISYENTVKKMNNRTKAIIVPHMYGIPADIEGFLELGIPVIEDCAQSVGAKFKNQKVGTIGDISVFSFYATKLLTTGKGGAVYSKNRELIDSVYDLVNFDCRPEYKIRYNYHLSDFQAALGLSQLMRLNSFIKRRKEIAERYNEIIEKKKDAFLVEIPDTKENVWYRYVIISEKDPEKMKKRFLKSGISTINPLERWELLHRYLKLNPLDFPNAEGIVRKTISIPIFPSLKEEEILRVCKAMNEILE